MGILHKIFTWYILLSKRFLRKTGFILVLIAVPLLMFGLSFISKKESSIINIGIVVNKSDSLSMDIISKLKSGSQAIKYIDVDSEEAGIELIKSGEISAVWIFPEDLQDGIEAYAVKHKSIFHIIENGDNVLLRLAREGLYKQVFSYISYEVYINFMHKNILIDEQLKDSDKLSFEKDIIAYYNNIHIDGDLVDYVYLDGDDYVQKSSNTNYLLSPIRGLMAVWLMLCGFMACIYYKYDEESGLFSLIDLKRRIYVLYGYQLCILINTGIVMIVSLCILGQFTEVLREIITLTLYILAIIGFCNLYKMIIRNIYIMLTLAPVILMLSIALSPIFFDIGIRYVQYLFPTYYYISAVYNSFFIIKFLVYALVLHLIYMLVNILSVRLEILNNRPI